MEILLWILAFLGIVIIYGGAWALKLILKATASRKTITLVKLVGVLLSAASLVLLWQMGLLK